MGQTYSETVDTGQPTGADAPEPEQTSIVPEKFLDKDGNVNVEALAKSYTELEKGAPVRGEDGKFTPKEEPNPEGEGLAITPPENPQGLFSEQEMSDYMGQVLADGDLSEDAYKAIEAKGLPKSLVENYVQGMKAQQASARDQVYQQVGGAENYSAMTEWAGNNLSQDQIEAFNTAIGSGDSAQAQLAISGLHAQYNQAQGGTLVTGQGGAGGNNIKPYGTSAEMVKDMSDERYVNGDAEFHSYVERRIAAGMK